MLLAGWLGGDRYPDLPDLWIYWRTRQDSGREHVQPVQVSIFGGKLDRWTSWTGFA